MARKVSSKSESDSDFQDNIEHPAVATALSDLENAYGVLAKKVEYFNTIISRSEKIIHDDDADYIGIFDAQEEGGYVELRCHELETLKSNLKNFTTVTAQLESMNDLATTLQNLLRQHGDTQYEDIEDHSPDYVVADEDDLFENGRSAPGSEFTEAPPMNSSEPVPA